MSGGSSIESLCRAAADRAAAARPRLRAASAAGRARLIRDAAARIRACAGAILDANARDLADAAHLDAAMRDRLLLDSARLEAMAAAAERVADQPDPLGQVIESRPLASGIRLEKRRVPIGVVLVVYESRPNVTSDAAALCLKSGNAVILRGGREAIRTNRALASAIRSALEPAGLADAVTFVDTTDRAALALLLGLSDRIDLAIPRGGPSLMRAVAEHARIPVIKHDAGNCHVYIDAHLDGLDEAAERIVVNAKAQRPGVCNAAETLLVHAAVAGRILPRLGRALSAANVELRADERARAFLPGAVTATEEDWATEYLALILAVRVVDSLEDAAAHIRRYGSRHTEAIITSSPAEAERFIALVDSASVMVNCSTRFADGGEYGLGAEIGISTSALHARGPMGAADLTTYQWVALGAGQVRG